MNYHPLAQPVMLSEASSTHFFSSPDSHSNHHFYIDTVLQNRWLIAAITMTITLIGILIAYSVQPIYEASLLIHVEEKGQREPKNILGEAGSMLDLKTPATAEIELLRSRMVIARAIDELGSAIQVEPVRLPWIGSWVANRHLENYFPELQGLGAYAWGDEKLSIKKFDVPALLENQTFIFEVQKDHSVKVSELENGMQFETSGTEMNTFLSEYGPITLQLGQPVIYTGTKFHVTKNSKLTLIENIQKSLTVAEIGKQSGVISAILKGENASDVYRMLSEIGRQYIAQNAERRTEEAELSLAYLNKKLPELKQQLEQGEAKYNRFRNSHGTVDLGEEAKINLQRTATARAKRIELDQKRTELLSRYTDQHPLVQSVDTQIKDIDKEMLAAVAQIKMLPTIEQELVRLSRDVKINSELYGALLATAQQLQLIEVGKTSNVRLIDTPLLPEHPVTPNRPRIIAASIFLGVFFGIIFTLLRRGLQNTVEEPMQIEHALGLPIFASIPHSKNQEDYDANRKKLSGLALLAKMDGFDPAIESLRSLRAALQFSLPQMRNNIVLITGPTSGVGKSFISANLAMVMAASGRKILLIDADLRGGHLHDYFQCVRENGLTEALAKVNHNQFAIKQQVSEGLDFISTGKLGHHPSELLLQLDREGSLQALAKNYDMVIMDCSPVLAAADSLIVGAHAGTIFLVGRAGFTTPQDIAESLKRLSCAGLSAKGLLFNDMVIRGNRYAYRNEVATQIGYKPHYMPERSHAVSI
jgi:tyrosine-protein kinase Etk/Wzc